MTGIKNIKPSMILDRVDILGTIDANHSYQKSYQYFVEYFSDGRALTEMDLVIGANFTYGWMPTILNFKNLNFDLAVDAINAARGEIPISNSKLKALKSLINNSLVGTSKLLHFINPEVYPIWDSKVCKFLLGKHNQKILGSLVVYKDYIELCNEVSLLSDYKRCHEIFIAHIGYEVSKLRTIEQIMFYSTDKPLKLE